MSKTKKKVNKKDKNDNRLLKLNEIKRVKWLKPKSLFSKAGLIAIFVAVFSALTLLEDTGLGWMMVKVFQ